MHIGFISIISVQLLTLFLEGGCYEVDPKMKIATINADSSDVYFKFHADANCHGNTVYSGATSDTVITVKKFSAGSVQLTCPRKSRR